MNFLEAEDEDDVVRLIEENENIVLKFYKDDCPACKMLSTSIGKASVSPEVVSVVLNVKMETLGEAYFRGLGLRQTPTLHFYKKGELKIRQPGFVSPETFTDLCHQAFE